MRSGGRHQISPLRWLWLTWAVVALFMAATAFWIFVHERDANLAAAESRLDTEFTYLQHMIAAGLRNGSFEQVDELIDAWGRLNRETVSLTLTADNGYVIGAYDKAVPETHFARRSATISFAYQGAAELRLEKSLAGVHAQIAALRGRLLFGTVVFQLFALLMILQLYKQRQQTQLARHEYEKRVSVQSAMERMAKEDALTGLPNRRQLEQALGARVAEASRYGRRLAVLFIDLDNFKQINDSFGHETGDELLTVTAERMRQSLREFDLLARFGGDEFVVILSNVTENAEVERVAGKLLDSIRPPVQLADHESFVSATIGVSLFPDDADAPADLLRHADAAMYRAKESGRDCFGFFTASLNERTRKARAIETGLHRALADGELYLVYQPKMDLRTRRVGSCEALLRWCRDGTHIPPGEFIPIAERSVLMRQIENFVIEQAVRQRAAWARLGIDQLRIDINLSGQRLLVGDTLSRFASVAQSHGVPPDQIGIELTEHTLIEAGEETIATLSNLREQGCRISLDDFGTGYSSLSYLKRLPVDVLKIDRGFIHELPDNRQDASIVSAICAMGHSLGKRILAEGVETEAQLASVSASGCDMVQGYLVGRPVRAEDFIDWLRAHQGRTQRIAHHG
jgi:diguanylate cyclase (GGDEF)-like protein